MLLTDAALHVPLLVVSATTTAVLAGYGWHRRETSGSLPFALLMLATAVWAATYAVGIVTLDPAQRLFWQDVYWVAIVIIPVAFLLFAFEYTGHDRFVKTRVVAALSVVPAVTVLLVWTNPAHELIWTENRVVIVGDLALTVESFGPWFWLYIAYGYGLILVAAGLLVRLIYVSDSLFFDQSVLLLTGTAAPLLANVVSVALSSAPLQLGIDLTPYGFTVTGLAFGAALFRHRLFDLVPAAYRLGRDAAIRDMQDGVLILDSDRRVIYCNPAATEMLDRERAEMIEVPVRTLLGGDFDGTDGPREWTTDDGVFEIRTSPIRDRRDRTMGYTLVVQDITARKRRERRLARQREELERLEQLNTVVRSVNRALVSATSREEIERAVCDQLAEIDRYRTVCIADLPTWDGDSDRWTVAGVDGDTTVPAGVRENGTGPEITPESPTAASVRTDGDDWTVVPVTYGRTVYGALGLCASRDASGPAVTDREREVLTELGEAIGHAIDAVENQRLLSAESVLELDFRSEDDTGVLLAAAANGDCRLDISGLVPEASTGHLAYVQVTEGDPEAAADALGRLSGTRVRQVRGADDGETPLVEWMVPPESLLGALIEHGAHVLHATAEEGTVQARVEMAADEDVRALVDRLQRSFPDTWLEAKRERTRPAEQADSISGHVLKDLTDRQQQVLEAAYRAGYFDWPRDSTAEEVAETLDISSPTLHAHLRKAEAELLADLFDRDARRSDREQSDPTN